jgi:hypothetical protein
MAAGMFRWRAGIRQPQIGRENNVHGVGDTMDIHGFRSVHAHRESRRTGLVKVRGCYIGLHDTA